MVASSEQSGTEVVRVPDTARFAILVNGEPAGFAAYVDDRGDDHDRRIFFHTVIEDGFTGRGLAGRLVGEALAQTVAEGLRIVPVCPYVAKYVTTHHPVTDTAGGTAGDAVADAIDPVTPEALDAVRAVAEES